MSRSVWRFYPDFVIDGSLNPLFATEVSFGCLNRNVTEQELNLLQFAPGGVAKPCTGSAPMRRSCGANLSMFDFAALLPNHVPNCLLGQSFSPGLSHLVDATK